MEDVLFSIDQLACSYSKDENQKVLYIEQLRIPRGRIVFLLGASGCGKSTLLETLGLMNNTIASGRVELASDTDKGTINLPDLWLPEKEAVLTEVRKKYYSFIFQNTNLMENFTAYENVCLSGMIKEDVAQEAVLPDARLLMDKIKLPEGEVNLETLAVNLSGGQRQRLAFARAFNNKATVLFGDEPTGNLDEANAHELFELIKSNSANRLLSSIIVSHDINLAVKYADQIIVITKEKGNNHGEIKSENIFNKSDWEACTHAEIAMFKDLLRSLYEVANEHKNAARPTGTKVNTALSYYKLFARREGSALVGKKMSNFFILSTILVFTFLAVGFANGSLDYLNKQLNDAFVNWITVTIPLSQADVTRVNDLVDELRSDSVRNRFDFQSATPYVRQALSVYDLKLDRSVLAKARSIDTSDSQLLHDFILGKDNVVRSGIKDGFKDQDVAVIVTQRFLEDYNYPENANFIYCSLRIRDTANRTKDIRVPIQVRAIVKVLPEKRQLIYPLFFYKSFMTEHDPVFDTTKKKNNFSIFYGVTKEARADSFKLDLTKFLYSKGYGSAPDQINDTVGFQVGYRYDVQFDSLVDEAVIRSLLRDMRAGMAPKYDTNLICRAYQFNPTEVNKSTVYDGISIYFKRLDSVRAFSRFLLSKSDDKTSTDVIEVDETTLKDKENFNFLSNVTKVISLLLIIFSALAVCLFIYNLLKSHLSKVKINIGTFKAIGLTDGESRGIYFGIILNFILVAVAVSFVLAIVVGSVINFVLVKMNNVNNISYFKILDFFEFRSAYNLITLVTIIWIISCALVLSRVTIRKILSKTPGDLIYNR